MPSTFEANFSGSAFAFSKSANCPEIIAQWIYLFHGQYPADIIP
jgi:hypothetical protein